MSLNLNGLLIDKKFIALDAKLRSGNIFRALNVADNETRHTRFLAYLLNPNETHGLDDAFLESFLLNTWKAIDLDLRITDLDLDMASVFCEWSGNGLDNKRIDVLIKIPYKRDSNHFYVVAIEAKVNSNAGKNQLSDYTKKLDDAGFSKEHRLCLFLVKNEEENALKEWHQVFWQGLILSALQTTTHRYKNIVSPKIASILDDYVEIISEWSADDDPVLNEFLESLSDYKNVLTNHEAKFYLEAKHSLAYYALAAYFNEDERSNIKSTFKAWAKDKKIVIADSNNSYLRFYPTSTAYPYRTDLHSKSRKWISQNIPLLFEINIKKSTQNVLLKSRISLVMGPLESEFLSEREALVIELRNAISLESSAWSAARDTVGEEFARVLSYPPKSEYIDPSAPEIIFNKYFDEALKITAKINMIIDQSFLAIPIKN